MDAFSRYHVEMSIHILQNPAQRNMVGRTTYCLLTESDFTYTGVSGPSLLIESTDSMIYIRTDVWWLLEDMLLKMLAVHVHMQSSVEAFSGARILV